MVEELSQQVRQLLLDHIESYDHLDVLLLLHESGDAGRADWTLADVCQHLHAPPPALASALEALHGGGLLRRERISPQAPAVYRYAPEAPALAPAVDELARLYRQQPLTIMKAMAANSIERIRGAALRAFADAFDLSKRNR